MNFIKIVKVNISFVIAVLSFDVSGSSIATGRDPAPQVLFLSLVSEDIGDNARVTLPAPSIQRLLLFGDPRIVARRLRPDDPLITETAAVCPIKKSR